MEALKLTPKYVLVIPVIILLCVYAVYIAVEFLMTISNNTLFILIGIYVCRNMIMGLLRFFWFVLKIILFFAMITLLFI